MRSWLTVFGVLLLGLLGCGVTPTASPPPEAPVAPALSVSIWGEVPKQCA